MGRSGNGATHGPEPVDDNCQKKFNAVSNQGLGHSHGVPHSQAEMEIEVTIERKGGW